MRISIKSELKLEQIVDIELVQRGQVEISFKGEVLETLPMVVFNNLFARRNKFKGKVVEEGKIMPIRYYDLHRHSGYSLLDGMNKIDAMVEKTEYAGAISDHGVMFGVLDYYKKMKEAGKLPILGFEAYSESIDGKKSKNHLLLLAKTEKGFKNLVKLTSFGYENFYKKPQLSYDMLKKYSEGIIVSTACLGGEVPRLLKQGKMDEAKEVCLNLISIFGKENFYIEVQRHNIIGEDEVNKRLIELAKELDVKVIATTDSHFTEKQDSKIHEILLCMQTKKTMNDPERWIFPGTGYHLHTSEEMEEIWADMPEVLDNTLDLVESINCELEFGKIYMPSFPIPEGFKDEAEYFTRLCWKGFEERFKGTDNFTSEEYRERLQFEIDTIKGMGFPGYFVIVWDFVNFAKSRGILMGPGRGSACGSLVAYALKITEVDPIPYGLLFERFLNPDRVSMPDIDLDFDDRRREEVIDYVKGKYGERAVSRIITFGTLSAKAVVRDVARVLGKPYILGNKISKAIPKTPGITLNKAFEESQELANMYANDKEVKEIIDIAKKLEGLPKSMGTHACGVIISKSDVDNFIPQILVKDKKTKNTELTTQFTMAECEERGLLKMDFLGLRTMGVSGRCLEDVNIKRSKLGLEPIDFLDIPINDVNVYNFISKGHTQGIFQLESPGMTSFMTELFQDVNSFIGVLSKEALYKKGEELFERLIAGISLYRPGPIDEIPNYIKNMLNPEEITYELPELKSILDNTYSVIVYQEQCMFVVRELAGFTKGMADSVRKAFSKKKQKMIAPLGEKFLNGVVDEDGNVVVDGCLRRGINEEVAKGIWAKMEKFGSYAFNKSHATGYAVISIKTGWLAYYYPTEYMCATLNSFITKSDKIKTYLSICKKKNIQVLPPNVNTSREVFTVDGENIRFGLMGIRDMGKVSTLVINERDERGDFLSFQDFAERMAKHQKVDKGVLEALVYSGSVDNFPGTRRAKLSIIPKIISVAKVEKKIYNSPQMNFFELAQEQNNQEFIDRLNEEKAIEIPDLEEFDKRYKLEKEKEFAGFYITEHPLDDYYSFFEKEGVYEIGLLCNSDEDNNDDDNDSEERDFSLNGQNIKIAGIVKDINTFYTKSKNEPMNVFTIEDRTGEIKCVTFPKDKIKNEDKIVEGKIVILNGKIQDDERGLQIIVKTMVDVDAMKLSQSPQVIFLKGSKDRLWARKQWSEVKNLANENKGNTDVVFEFNGQKHIIPTKIKFDLSAICSLQSIMGEKNIHMVYSSLKEFMSNDK